jgi:hypothetical protein
MTDRGPLLVYLHVPKTGGNSVRAVLKSWLGQSFRDVFLTDDAIASGEVVRRVPEDLVEQLNDPSVRSVALNTGVGVHRQLRRDVRYMTVLREPRRRLLSYWQYAYMTRDKKPRWKLYERHGRSVRRLLGERVDPGLVNDQVRRISGATTYNVNETDLSAAIDNLQRHFEFVTTTDRITRDLPAFLGEAWKPGWQVPRFNQSTTCPLPPSAKELDLLEQVNNLDSALYRWVNDTLDAHPAHPMPVARVGGNT